MAKLGRIIQRVFLPEKPNHCNLRLMTQRLLASLILFFASNSRLWTFLISLLKIQIKSQTQRNISTNLDTTILHRGQRDDQENFLSNLFFETQDSNLFGLPCQWWTNTWWRKLWVVVKLRAVQSLAYSVLSFVVFADG